MFELELRAEFRTEFWNSLPEALREAIREKTIDQTIALYNKVMENVEGKILHSKSGQLAESIKYSSKQDGDAYTGSIYVSPATPKAFALEYGGKDYYSIVPVNKKMLHFFWEKVGMSVYLDYVDHPPSKEFGYLRTALEDVNLAEGYTQVVDEVLRRGL